MAGLRRKNGGKAGFENPYCGPSFLGFFLFPESTKDIKDTAHLNELSLSLFPCSKNIAESLVKVLSCNLKCQK